MDKLKPCPFCGGEAKIKENGAEYNYISCKRCKNGTAYGYQDQVIARWNTRAERTCKNTQHDLDFMCSECGKCVDNGRVIKINYCPNCGAKVVE